MGRGLLPASNCQIGTSGLTSSSPSYFSSLLPSLLRLSNMELGRIISRVNGESYCTGWKTWLTKIFVYGDMLSFFFQGGGTYSKATFPALS